MNTVKQISVTLRGEAQTAQLGAALAALVKPGFMLYLSGGLGAGKTTLTRALLRALGVTGSIKSPTYALLEPYEIAALPEGVLHHFDFYRLQSKDEWRGAGFEEAFVPPHAAIVEWPEMAGGLPPPSLQISLLAGQYDDERTAHLSGAASLIKALGDE